jgi:septal ring factor EnvC (AmiA/AmiB activator)
LTEQTATNKRQHDQELIRIRAKQQEIANQKAKEAAQKRKEKEAQERARKNKVAQKKADETETSKGTTLGRLHNNNTGSTEGTTTTGYNPMQPWSGTSRGYRYVR